MTDCNIDPEPTKLAGGAVLVHHCLTDRRTFTTHPGQPVECPSGRARARQRAVRESRTHYENRMDD